MFIFCLGNFPDVSILMEASVGESTIMDEFISAFPSVDDGDLMLCEERGVAYQADMSFRVDVPYFDKCNGYVGSEIGHRLNFGRVHFVNHFVGSDFSVLDVGVGAGEFVARRSNTWGYDVDEKAVALLRSINRWSDDFRAFRAFTFWDVIEHVEDPNIYFRHMAPGTRAFFSIPVFKDLKSIRESRHYRPGEHLYYWTDQGFIDWMHLHRFDWIGWSDFETEAGRDSIKTFAFQRMADE